MTDNPYTVEGLKRIKAECDAAGTPYPWARDYKMVISGDARIDYKSSAPIKRSKCPKCGYTLTTNEAPQAWECPIDGETLGSVPYP